jgi:N-hydroxyarylamine O-acetyltransferase
MSQSVSTANSPLGGMLAPALRERVLAKLGFAGAPAPTLENLRALYAGWCQRVPFDNVRKLIHVRAGNSGPLPGSTAEDFLEAWLTHGTGGTCWAGAVAFHALLDSLGYDVARGVGTMLVAPDLPPNHGSVQVTFGAARYLVDCSILHGEPLRLKEDTETRVEHAAWGVRCAKREGRWYVQWRPLLNRDGFECRLERFGATDLEFRNFYEQTRGWSPFNYEVTARLNRGDHVVGLAFGKAILLEADGGFRETAVTHAERVRLLIDDIGLSEEIVQQLPEDIATPPPPDSRTARAAAE